MSRLARRCFALSTTLVLVLACDELRIPIGTTAADSLPLRPAVCDEVPLDTNTPVKVLLVLDDSGSLQFTDQQGARFAAIEAWAQAVAAGPSADAIHVASVSFGVASRVSPLPGPGQPLFVPVSQWDRPTSSEAQVQTDYQGMLKVVREHLLRDMLASTVEELALTRYVVVFFTDGAPTPICCNVDDEIQSQPNQVGVAPDELGCGREAWEEIPSQGTFCGAIQEQGICGDQALLDRYREVQGVSTAPDYGDGPIGPASGLVVDGDYNRPAGIAADVAGLHALAADFGTTLNINVGFLFDDTLTTDIRQIFGLNRCRVAANARVLAGDGGRVLTFGAANEIDFRLFSTSPLCPAFEGDCDGYCRSNSETLDALGVDAALCDDEAIVNAGDDCAACEAAFAAQGLSASVCPAEPS